MEVMPRCPADKHHLGTLTRSVWGKDFSSDLVYGARPSIPTELNRCLNVFVVGFEPEFSLTCREKNQWCVLERWHDPGDL